MGFAKFNLFTVCFSQMGALISLGARLTSRSDASLWRNGHLLVMVARCDATLNGICATLARVTRLYGFFSSSRILFLHDCQRLATMVSGLSCEDPEVRSFVPAGGAVKLCDEGSVVIIDAREPRAVGI